MRIRTLAIPILALCAVLLGLAPPAQATAPKQVLVLGDSLVGGASNYINFYMNHDGRVNTTIRSIGGTAPCDLLPGNGGPWTIDGLLAEKRYDAVVVAYSGNSMTPCMGNRRGQAVADKYREDAWSIMGATHHAGVQRVVWVKPPSAASAELDGVRSRVGSAYESLPSSWSTARVIDGGIGVEWGSRFTPWIPCEPWERTAAQGCVNGGFIRVGADDGVHFYCARRGPAWYGVVPPCDVYSSGSNRYGMNLAATRAFIGL